LPSWRPKVASWTAGSKPRLNFCSRKDALSAATLAHRPELPACMPAPSRGLADAELRGDPLYRDARRRRGLHWRMQETLDLELRQGFGNGQADDTR
jgi:hypothetical protein